VSKCEKLQPIALTTEALLLREGKTKGEFVLRRTILLLPPPPPEKIREIAMGGKNQGKSLPQHSRCVSEAVKTTPRGATAQQEEKKPKLR
jgi:hypothetical protein